MSRPFQSIGRRHFLGTAAIGAIAGFLPLSSAGAATMPPSTPGAETLSPAQPIPTSTVTIADTAVIATAAVG